MITLISDTTNKKEQTYFIKENETKKIICNNNFFEKNFSPYEKIDLLTNKISIEQFYNIVLRKKEGQEVILNTIWQYLKQITFWRTKINFYKFN